MSSSTRALLIAGIALSVLAGCGRTPASVSTSIPKSDWSGVASSASCSPKRAPYLGAGKNARPADAACNAKVEARSPLGYVLTPQAAEFRRAEEMLCDTQRLKLAQALVNTPGLVNTFRAWDRTPGATKLAVLKSVAALEGRVFDFTPPPITVKSGVPEDGTLAYFDGSDCAGKVVLYPSAIEQGDPWMGLATILHEMRHAYQAQLALRGMKRLLKSGSPEESLAYGFAQSYTAVNQVGGEDKLSYGDYCHLCIEWDAFATGNMVTSIVSQGEIDTAGMGFADLQFDAMGESQAPIRGLEALVGPAKLLDAVNQAQLGSL
ncbi:MAG: hypothetical protein JWM80_5863 [Cyanobacteria bacterium RYN_339]|nr:hypothetical protein [Cyanobacteria bacterium RYN_339]